MIFRILLLINLNSCVSAGAVVVNVTQTSYQAEENHNITLECIFTTKLITTNSVKIFCILFINHKEFILFHLHDGVEVPESQDQQFSGRVKFDKDILREGRIRLQLSRLRTNDSGLYLCEVNTGYSSSIEEWKLSVTAADQLKPQRPTVSPEPENRERTGLYVGLTAAVLLVPLCFALSRCFTKSTDKTEKSSVQ